MNRLTKMLAGVLGLQVALIAGLGALNHTGTAGFESEPLLSFQRDDVDQIVVHSGESTVTIAKQDGQWVLPDSNHLPVDSTKLETSLDRLERLATTWPVTTTTSSHERFEVAEEKFQRKIELYQNGKQVDEFYVGNSPGFRSAHVRKGSDNNVYSLEINTFDFPDSSSDWIDKKILSVSNVTSVKRDEFEIKKETDEWKLMPRGEDQEVAKLDDAAAVDLENAIRNLRVTDISDVELDVAGGETKEIDVVGDSNVKFWLKEIDGKHLVKRSDIDSTFEISSYHFEKLAEANLEKLQVADNEVNGDEETSETDS